MKIRKRRQKESTEVKAPVTLFEDTAWSRGKRHSLAKQPDRRPAPKVVSTCRIPRSEVEDRLMRGMKTLRAVPDRERRFFVVSSTSPDYVREYIDAYDPDSDVQARFQPTPADVSDYLTALSWVRHLGKPTWQILWWRSFDVSFGVIAKYIGRSDETARKRYETAITDAWIAANT